MFTIENLTKTYKNNVTAVNDFHLKIAPHQIVAVSDQMDPVKQR